MARLQLTAFKGMEENRLGNRNIWVLKHHPEIMIAHRHKGWQAFATPASGAEAVRKVKSSGVEQQAFETRRDLMEALEIIICW